MPTLKIVAEVGAMMRLTVFAAALTFLLWGTPAFADPDADENPVDHCPGKEGVQEDDTDDDGCGNFCVIGAISNATPGRSRRQSLRN